jgi:hypothetical protein
VERDPLAGIEPAAAPELTAAGVDAALAAEGWRHTPGVRGGYWFKVRRQNKACNRLLGRLFLLAARSLNSLHLISLLIYFF